MNDFIQNDYLGFIICKYVSSVNHKSSGRFANLLQLFIREFSVYEAILLDDDTVEVWSDVAAITIVDI